MIAEQIKYTLKDVRLNKPRKRNKENIRLWVEALRSGRYLQTTGRLSEQRGAGKRWRHCCLGVACEVEGTTKKTIIDNTYLPQATGKIALYDQSESLLPDKVIDWLGIRIPTDEFTEISSDPVATVLHKDFKNKEVTLSELNDEHGWTFAMIADLVERDWL